MSRHALVIGVADYRKDSALANLPAAHADLTAISSVLENRGDFEVKALRDPTSQQLTRELELLFQEKNPDDTVLVYFSGHGLRDENLDRLYLATIDSEQKHLDSSAVDSELLRRLAAHTMAQTKLMFLDCCFAGLAGEGLRARSARKVPLASHFSKHGTVLLTATDRTSPAFENAKTPNQPALFTEAVVAGLSGGAKDGDADGWISMQDITDYVQQSEKLRERQTPVIFANGVTGNLQIVRADGHVPEPVDSPAVAKLGRSPEPAQRPDAPLDDATWRRLLEYYLDCLRRENALSSWLFPKKRERYRVWPSRDEPIFTGSGQPVQLPEPLREFCLKNNAPGMTIQYGYPVVMVQEEGKPGKFAPLITAELTVSPDGLAEAQALQLNEIVLESHGLDAPEIELLRQHFAANFRYANPNQFAEQLRGLRKVLDLDISEELDPAKMSDQLRESPFVPGVQNVAIIYCTEESNSATANLVKDLRGNMIPKVSQFEDTALHGLQGPDTADMTDSYTLVTPGPLNESQEAVINSAMTRRLTVATGPPGTGKTALVTALTATAAANGQSILIGSTNNQAVDGVHAKANAIAPGLVIRTGKREHVDAEPETLAKLLRGIKPAADSGLLAGRMRSQHQRISAARAELDARKDRELDLLAAIRDQQRAIRELSGHAKVASLLESEDGQVARFATLAQRSIRRWPRGIWARRLLGRELSIDTVSQRRFLAVALELELSQRDLAAELAGMPHESEVWGRLKTLLAQRVITGQQLIAAHMNQKLDSGRAAIQQRIETVRDGKTYPGFQRLLRYLPGWASTGHSARKLVPQPGLFDLVVIDEAAQCPTPMVLGMLMRAKRALIIGDPHQIPPVVQLSQSDDDLIRRKHRLGDGWLKGRRLQYSGGSIYQTCARATGQVTLLDEHYRCDPAIVAVPNRAVYQNQLAVLTDTAQLAIPAKPPLDNAVQVIDVRGEVAHPSSGSCHNPIEANRVVELVTELRSRHPNATMGIVSPFRAHVNRVKRLLNSAGHGDTIKTGTAHSFQGDECDIIILSPVGSHGIRDNSAQWMIKQTNLWNVAITRAKSRLIVVCDRQWWTKHPSLLTELLEDAEQSLVSHNDTELLDHLQAALETGGINVLAREQVVAGQLCGLIIGGATKPRAVIIDVAPHDSGRAYRQLLSKLDLVAGAGYEPIRIPAWRCISEPTRIVEELRTSV